MGCAVAAQAQNTTIDSLKTLLPLRTADRATVLINLAREYNIIGDYNQAIDYADQAMVSAMEKGDSLQLSYAMIVKGASLRRQEKLDEALKQLVPAYGIAKRNNYVVQLKFAL